MLTEPNFGIDVTAVAHAAKLDISKQFRLWVTDQVWKERIKGPYAIQTDEYKEVVKLLSYFITAQKAGLKGQKTFDFTVKMAPKKGDPFIHMKAFAVMKHKREAEKTRTWICRASIIMNQPYLVFSEV